MSRWKHKAQLTESLIRQHYEVERMTLFAIGERYGYHETGVLGLMKKFGIKTRSRKESQPTVERWKPDAKYIALHMRVQKLRGKPNFCVECQSTDPSKQYDWANLTGRYDDPADYQRMCRSCHKRFDLSRKKPKVLNFT